jgi:hypothetical protein
MNRIYIYNECNNEEIIVNDDMIQIDCGCMILG